MLQCYCVAMPELSTATGILWYPAKTIKCHEGKGGTAAESYPTKGGQNKAHSEQD